MMSNIDIKIQINPKNAIPDKHGIFFTAFYVSVDHKVNESYCGADITVKMNQSTVLTSPNYPSMYTAGVICKWILRVRKPSNFFYAATVFWYICFIY